MLPNILVMVARSIHLPVTNFDLLSLVSKQMIKRARYRYTKVVLLYIDLSNVLKFTKTSK